MPKQINDNIFSYGDWDDTYSQQFIVDYHCNGKDCTVIVLAGCDYGGGISCHAIVPILELENILQSTDENSYKQYIRVEELVKAYK